MPVTIAARAIARAVVLANTTPPHDYGGQKLTGVTPGADGVQWDYTQRNLAVNSGSSTTVVKDGVVEIGDLVTTYHPAADPVDEWRFVVDLVRLQNVIYNLNLYLATLDGRPIINDGDATNEATAISPSTVKAGLAGVLSGLGLAAILADVINTNKLITVVIDGNNSKRFNITTPVKLSGNANIIDLVIEYSFNLGTAAA
jgi:phage tail sheath gpL-like